MPKKVYEMKMTSLNNSKGFTLIELMLAMVIGLMVLAGATYTYTKQSDVIRQGNQESQTRGMARLILDDMVREIRRAGMGMPPGDSTAVTWDTAASAFVSDPVKQAQHGITNADTTTLTYEANTDNLFTYIALDSLSTDTKIVVSKNTNLGTDGFKEGDKVVFFDTEKPWVYNTLVIKSILTAPFIVFDWAGNPNKFKAEPNDNGVAVVVQNYHTITYTYNAGAETITVTDDMGTAVNTDDTTTVIASNVTNMVFTYFPTTGATAYTVLPLAGNDLALMRRMNISITVRDRVEDTVTQTYDTDIVLRNLGT